MDTTRIGQNTLNVLAIGAELVAVKKALKRGDWGDWLDREFDWSEELARKMMAATRRFKSVKFTDLAIEPSALYVLAAKKTLDRVVEQALELARKGETITHAKAKTLVKDDHDWAGERVEQPVLALDGDDLTDDEQTVVRQGEQGELRGKK
jgi:hypothetical protein